MSDRYRSHPSVRHGGPRILKMAWSNLLFLHWPMAPELLRPHVPNGLEVDTFNGQAWIGVIPFRMSGVRPILTPAVPGLSSFLELNVRTYVIHRGERGVYFFSLDASSAVAVWMARTFFHLPYFRARMQLGRRGDSMRFASRRTHQGAQSADFECIWAAGQPLPRSKPGELAHFVTERYQLFTEHRGRIFCCEVAHDPWPLREARVGKLRSTVIEAAGLPTPRGAPVAHHSDALAIEVCPLREALSREDAPPLLDPAPASFAGPQQLRRKIS